MTTTIYVPQDSSALSLGAERVARAIVREAAARGTDIRLVRNGSRGLYWLEPMVEVMVAGERHAYGPVAPGDVASLFDCGFLTGAPHALGHGRTESIPYLAKQQRLTFQRVGIVDPGSVADYLTHGGYTGLRNALAMSPGDILKAVTDSGLRGRGGAAFPTGIKWKTVADQRVEQKYVACNADEGDSGTFSDRMIMEGDPLALIEGMTIAGIAVGATMGYIYARAEYPHACRALARALDAARAANFLGENIQGSGKRFDIEVRVGAGAYVCGEETSMLESLEGKRGEVRAKPPLPAIEGLFGKPTVVNNVISLATVPVILARGADYYRDFGVGRSRGTLPLQLTGNLKFGGLVELAFGCTLRELLYDYAGGSATGRPLKTVQVGGPLGAYVPASEFDVVVDYEALAATGALLGHGGIVAFDDTVDMAHMARYAMEFCATESCGKCTPCRIGSTRGQEVIGQIKAGVRPTENLKLLNELLDTMQYGSLCGLGGMTPFPVRSALKHFPADFGPSGA